MKDEFQIKTIGFTNGEFLTFEQAANLIEQEGRLTFGSYIYDSMRCALAVLENHIICQECLEPICCYKPESDKRIENIWFAVCLSNENNREVGDGLEKPEDRCSRIVAWLRK